MTAQECECRDQRFIRNIQSMMAANEQLRIHANRLRLSIENAAVVIRGELPSTDLKAELVPVVRQAGVLSRVCDYVQVNSTVSAQ